MKHVDVVVVGAGQAGLATACALVRHGLKPVVLEASDQSAGSWPRYYDSLTLFSPARFSSLPGMPFGGGDPDRYPHRDEVVAYLTTYAARLDADIRTGRRVAGVHVNREGGFVVTLEGGARISARAVVSASGSFGSPYRPTLPGLDRYEGAVLHASEYRGPEAFAGRRVIVVGAGNTAVQMAVELASVARVTLASRTPVKFVPQRILGRDMHFWLVRSGVDAAPIGCFLRTPPTQPVFDTGRYRAAVDAGIPDRRPLFTSIAGKRVVWSDGVKEEVGAIVLATGYRPDLPYLAGLGIADGCGRPLHRDGFSVAHERLAFVGLECQRSLSSNSLRGVGRDADRVARRLASGLRSEDAPG
ncbi:NAD(P)/FAD-dependent oxidoreductase [Streptomyces sp. DK15]|uniref:flavin-containing monooxygenase n=1 Tax=Streptomyces sp. DK15 TaxID=2957499 RepID=UPI0029A167CD|nr:NAD(P)/FAD-dependent oxidoreductase [Streptomyces sp. DK15]MDX2396413.1 NAD(P)/FAD-dependent oxidoreductase [Streptomyces sp. DK15]